MGGTTTPLSLPAFFALGAFLAGVPVAEAGTFSVLGLATLGVDNVVLFLDRWVTVLLLSLPVATNGSSAA